VKRLSRSFEYIFAEDDWFNSVLIGGLYIVLIPLLAGLIMVMGFQVELTRNIMRGEKRMPLWRHPVVLFRSGIRSFAVSLCYAAGIIAVLVVLQIPVISITTLIILVLLHLFLNPLLIRRYAVTQSIRKSMNPIALAQSAAARFPSYLGGILLTSSLIFAAVMFGWMWIVVGWPILIFLMMIVQTIYFTEQ
jgi:hypothetical protein